ncbi:hypothetical protein EYS14_06435 [Alteromonadaceae bacterium M269]|nr:hypothetical protein EYS14_06435 [Alteromonadaceae bacterium M269]
MSMIEPVQEVTRQLDRAYEALAADPQSSQKQQNYDRLKDKRDALMSDTWGRMNQAFSGA